jgi:siroheme synthase-like protein
MNRFVAQVYPLLLDVSDRLVVIVGGGKVAMRKAHGLLAAGATNVRCIALEIDPGMPAAVEQIHASFVEHHLDGAKLVFAATHSAAVNDQVVLAARRKGIFVNRADVDEENAGDFATPAMWRNEGVIITVSAFGSPAIAAAIRDDLASKLDQGQLRMAELMRRLRPLIRDKAGLSEQRRREVFRELAGTPAIEILLSGGEAALWSWLTERFEELKHLKLEDQR